MEECMYIIGMFLLRKTAGADAHHASQHRQSRRQLLLQFFPVGLHPFPERSDAVGVGAQTSDREVDVLAFYFVRERKSQGFLDEVV